MKLKQKKTSLILIITVAIVVFAWQVYELLNSDISSNSATNASLANTNETPAEKSIQLRQSLPPKRLQTQPVTHSRLTQAVTERDAPDDTYLTLVNRYKLASMQHKLLQEELSIAKVKHEISTLTQNTSTEANDVMDNFGVSQTNPPKISEIQLVYLDNQNAKWSAILKDKSGYHQVNSGSALSNGATVVEINKNGVLLEINQHRFNLSFSGITPLPENYSAALPQKHGHTLHTTLHASKLKKSHHTPTHQQTITAEQKIIQHKFKPKATPIKLKKLPLTTLITHTKSVKTKPTEKKSAHTLDETVLLELPPSSYTILLKHASDLNEIRQYAKKFHIDNRTFCYSLNKNNKPHYYLVYGDYLTTRAAKSALEKLPVELIQNSHSIESLKSIQKEIQ